MKKSLIIAAAFAAITAAPAAFAGEGAGDPFPFHPTLTQGEVFNNATLPERGQNGPVESANSLPPGALVGTAEYARAQELQHWYASQQDHRFAARSGAGVVGPKG